LPLVMPARGRRRHGDELRNPVASVTIGPVLVNGLPCRLIELADGSGRVQSWVEGHWVTGGASVSELMVGTPCADPETGAPPVTPPVG
jgi:hypothetical protein